MKTLKKEMTSEQLKVIDEAVADYFNTVGSKPKRIKMNLNTREAIVDCFKRLGNASAYEANYCYRGMKVIICEDLNYGEVQLEGEPWHEDVED